MRHEAEKHEGVIAAVRGLPESAMPDGYDTHQRQAWLRGYRLCREYGEGAALERLRERKPGRKSPGPTRA